MSREISEFCTGDNFVLRVEGVYCLASCKTSLRVILQKYTKFEHFTGLYFPHVSIFCKKISQFY